MSDYAWKLSNRKFVHPTCREPYQKRKAKAGAIYPSIESAVYPGFPLPEGRFTMCDHCQRPIWGGAL